MSSAPGAVSGVVAAAAGVALAVLVSSAAAAGGTFTLANNTFLLDGSPTVIRACDMHYFRIHPSNWRDRVTRAAALGCNAVQTYVAWNFHERARGAYDFTGARDLGAFLDVVDSVGLKVLLRPGPYICAEWDFGGLPWWLLEDPSVVIRTYSKPYIDAVTSWWTALFAVVAPRLHTRGGAVLMVQIENEYGSYGNVQANPLDKQYMEYLLTLAKQTLGQDPADVVYYTTDGGDTGYMSRGTLPGELYTVGDFGPGSNPNDSFAAMRQFNPPGKSPNFVSEFYSGWLTHWGENVANTSAASFAQYLDQILAMGASVSSYMGHGGTNFGFGAGANGGGESFQPHITAYDYDAPISEGGGHGYGSDNVDKFLAVRQVMQKYASGPLPPDPPAPAVASYPDVAMTSYISLADSLAALTSRVWECAAWPCTMEAAGQPHGLMWFDVGLSGVSGSLAVQSVRDLALAFAGQRFLGSTYRSSPSAIAVPPGTRNVSLLVDVMGHLNYGGKMTDPKGILGGVTVDGAPVLLPVTVHSLPLDFANVSALPFRPIASARAGPAFFRAQFSMATAPADTYVAVPGWTKGYIWVNGFNLGRYWESQGPQHAFYVPAAVLQVGANDVVVLELFNASAAAVVVFRDAPEYLPPGAPCNPAGIPAVGSLVSMHECSGGFSGAQQWLFDGGAMRVAGSPTLCLAGGPARDPATGNPAAELTAACGGAGQGFAYNDTTRELTEVAPREWCLDITGHAAGDDANVELYACNGGTNQQWAVDTSQASTVVSAQPGALCLTVCGL